MYNVVVSMDVLNPSGAIMPCDHGSEMRGRCLLLAFSLSRRTRVAFSYLTLIVTPVAIDAVRCPADAACAANVRWFNA